MVIEEKQSPEFLARVPEGNVWLHKSFPRQRLTLEESIHRHQELAHPSMMDNMHGFVFACFDLDMRTSKKVLCFWFCNVFGCISDHMYCPSHVIITLFVVFCSRVLTITCCYYIFFSVHTYYPSHIITIFMLFSVHMCFHHMLSI